MVGLKPLGLGAALRWINRRGCLAGFCRLGRLAHQRGVIRAEHHFADGQARRRRPVRVRHPDVRIPCVHHDHQTVVELLIDPMKSLRTNDNRAATVIAIRFRIHQQAAGSL